MKRSEIRGRDCRLKRRSRIALRSIRATFAHESRIALRSIRSVAKDSRDIIRELEADGWRFVGATGSHHDFKHPTKPGKVTLPHPRKDLHPKTVKSIYRQAQLQYKR